MLVSHASSLQMGITKFHQDNVDPLVIDMLLNSIHHKLRDLEERVFVDIFHINRLKAVFIYIPSRMVNTQGQLNKTIRGIELVLK